MFGINEKISSPCGFNHGGHGGHGGTTEGTEGTEDTERHRGTTERTEIFCNKMIIRQLN